MASKLLSGFLSFGCLACLTKLDVEPQEILMILCRTSHTGQSTWTALLLFRNIAFADASFVEEQS